MERIVRLEPLYSGYSKLFQATLRQDDGREVVQQIEDHGRAAAVLAYDPDRRVALVVKVARPAVVHAGETRRMLEPVAGMIEDEESAEQTARREALEEAGVSLSSLEPVGRVFSSPGVSTETLALFLAPFSAGDRRGAGGGAPGENEQVAAFELTLAELWRQVEAGEVADLKLLTLLQALRLRRPEVF